jgi:hypothetical protein
MYLTYYKLNLLGTEKTLLLWKYIFVPKTIFLFTKKIIVKIKFVIYFVKHVHK